jgi:preprotein translocase subunit SecE
VNAVSIQVAQELELVSWPNLRETRASTVAVVIFTFVAAFTLGIFDLVWSRLSALVY